MINEPLHVSRVATPDHSPEYAIYVDGSQNAVARVMGDDAKARADLFANAHLLAGLCERALLALHEDEFPQLRQEMREAMARCTPEES